MICRGGGSWRSIPIWPHVERRSPRSPPPGWHGCRRDRRDDRVARTHRTGGCPAGFDATPTRLPSSTPGLERFGSGAAGASCSRSAIAASCAAIAPTSSAAGSGSSQRPTAICWPARRRSTGHGRTCGVRRGRAPDQRVPSRPSSAIPTSSSCSRPSCGPCRLSTLTTAWLVVSTGRAARFFAGRPTFDGGGAPSSSRAARPITASATPRRRRHCRTPRSRAAQRRSRPRSERTVRRSTNWPHDERFDEPAARPGRRARPARSPSLRAERRQQRRDAADQHAHQREQREETDGDAKAA